MTQQEMDLLLRLEAIVRRGKFDLIDGPNGQEIGVILVDLDVLRARLAAAKDQIVRTRK